MPEWEDLPQLTALKTPEPIERPTLNELIMNTTDRLSDSEVLRVLGMDAYMMRKYRRVVPRELVTVQQMVNFESRKNIAESGRTFTDEAIQAMLEANTDMPFEEEHELPPPTLPNSTAICLPRYLDAAPLDTVPLLYIPGFDELLPTQPAELISSGFNESYRDGTYTTRRHRFGGELTNPSRADARLFEEEFSFMAGGRSKVCILESIFRESRRQQDLASAVREYFIDNPDDCPGSVPLQRAAEILSFQKKKYAKQIELRDRTDQEHSFESDCGRFFASERLDLDVIAAEATRQRKLSAFMLAKRSPERPCKALTPAEKMQRSRNNKRNCEKTADVVAQEKIAKAKKAEKNKALYLQKKAAASKTLPEE